MVNHVQTLLLNESASDVQSALSPDEYGYIDKSFTGVVPDRWVSGVYADMFSGVTDIRAKLLRARYFESFAYSPEFSWLPDGLDPRRTRRPDAPSDVFDFFSDNASAEADGPSLVPSVLSSPSAHLAFTPTGDGLADRPLEAMKEIFESSPEGVRKFAALVCAVVLHLHASYRRSTP